MSDFWDFIEKDQGTPRTLIRGRTLSLRLHCVRESAWEYRFVRANGPDLRDYIEGYVILDVRNKIMVRHAVTRDIFVRHRRDQVVIFQRILEPLFVDAKMYVGLPSLKMLTRALLQHNFTSRLIQKPKINAICFSKKLKFGVTCVFIS